ncbi:MAG TPA: copper resistance protein CopZ [Firmicutes bacterium]|jgi:copper chaperone|nr:copper resistance protein CopZ [Bacillota bacterium]
MANTVTKLNVEGMSCEHCVKSIKKAVGDLAGVNSVEVDLKAKTVTIDYDAQSVDIPMIKDAIADQGYEVK